MEREVPEADAIDQERDAFPGDDEDDEMVPDLDDSEVPEADAIEQAQPAPVVDDFGL